MSPDPTRLTTKGRARRETLLQAGLRVVERDGPAAVTHRAVAAEAGVATSAATYYFADLDDLLVSVLRRSVADYLTSVGPLDPTDIGGSAAALRRYAVEQRATAVAHYELLLLATRRPALREDVEQWYTLLERELAAGVASETPDATTRIRAAAGAVDGLILRMLWRGEPSSQAAIETALSAALAPLRA